MTKVYETASPQETMQIGKSMGETAEKGMVISLDGDLGVGKTVFTKGVALGLGISESVVSPTFTIVQEYEGGRLPMYHFDVYRIDDPDEMYEIGYEEYFYGEGVTLVEWATLIQELMPEDTVTVKIEKNPEKGDDYRKITVITKD